MRFSAPPGLAAHLARCGRACAPQTRGARARSSFAASLWRGGTSNALLLLAPPAGGSVPSDAQLAAAMGAPDAHGRQLDGLGGGTSSTSKVMLVMPSPPSKGGARVGEASQSQSQFRPDVCFRFGQVGVATGAVDWVGTCGNVSSAVARFAAEEGLGTPLPEHAGGASRMTRVRMLCQNTGAHVIADVGGVADPACELVSIPGVSGAAPPVWLRYQSPTGALTGKGRLLPSGEACDWLEVDGLRLQASLVDCTTGVVLLRAVDVGLNAEHNPPAMLPAASGALLERLEAARRAGAEAMGLDPNTPSVPKVGVVSGAPPGSGAHLSASFLSMGQPHKAIPLTAAMALAAAAFEGKSIVAEACSGLQQPQRAQQAQSVVIATPAGNVDVQVETTEQGAVACVSVLRTARRLADCVVYPP